MRGVYCPLSPPPKPFVLQGVGVDGLNPSLSFGGLKVSTWSLMGREVCDEVFDQEVFECLSSGVQDIAWIDLKHI